MLNVVVEIKAPEIVEVIRSLVGALIGAKPAEISPVQQTPASIPQVQQMQGYPQQPPIQQAETQYPVQGYVQPQQPLQPQQPQQVNPAAVPTMAPTYSMEQLAVAATQLMDAGRKNELMGLLASFGVQALTQLPKEQYGNFATQLRTMGAKI